MTAASSEEMQTTWGAVEPLAALGEPIELHPDPAVYLAALAIVGLVLIAVILAVGMAFR